MRRLNEVYGILCALLRCKCFQLLPEGILILPVTLGAPGCTTRAQQSLVACTSSSTKHTRQVPCSTHLT